MLARGLTAARQRKLGVAVAAGTVALALPNGGYYPRATAIATIVVWWVVLVGCAGGLLPRARPGRGALAFAAVLAAFAAWTAISLVWSLDDGRGFADVVRAAGYAGLALCVILLGRPGRAREWLGGLTAGTTVVVALALAGRYFPSLFDSGRGEIASQLSEASGRLAFPLGYWNALAGLAAANLLLLAGFAASAATRRARASLASLITLPVLAIFLTSSRGGVLSAIVGVAVLFVCAEHRQRWLAVSVVPLAVGGILVALANGRSDFVDDLGTATAASQGHTMLAFTLLGLLLAGVVVYVLDPRARALRLPRLPGRVALAGVSAAIAVAAVVFFAAGGYDSFKQLPPTAPGGSGENGAGAAHLVSSGSSGRWQFWSTAADALADQPFHGIGAGQYPAYWEQHGTIQISVQNAHSLALETLAELGTIGGLLLLGVLAIPVALAIRRLRCAQTLEVALALAVYCAVVAQALTDWSWQVPSLFSLALVSGAVAVGPAGVGTAQPALRRGHLRILRGIAILASLAAIGCAAAQLIAETKLESSRSALDGGDASGALSDAEGAQDFEPFAAAPRLQQALALEAQGKLDEATQALAGAIVRAPQDWTLWAVAERIDRANGDKKDAALARGAVLSLNPPVPPDPG
jgi:O-antigen ligase